MLVGAGDWVVSVKRNVDCRILVVMRVISAATLSCDVSVGNDGIYCKNERMIIPRRSKITSFAVTTKADFNCHFFETSVLSRLSQRQVQHTGL